MAKARSSAIWVASAYPASSTQLDSFQCIVSSSNSASKCHPAVAWLFRPHLFCWWHVHFLCPTIHFRIEKILRSNRFSTIDLTVKSSVEPSGSSTSRFPDLHVFSGHPISAFHDGVDPLFSQREQNFSCEVLPKCLISSHCLLVGIKRF